MQCVDIDIIDDSTIEGEHVFTVEIASVSPSSVIQCTSINTTFHIEDDDSEGEKYTFNTYNTAICKGCFF